MLSVICPVLNEEAYIKKVLDFFIEAKPSDKELLIVDGGSTDNTIAVVNTYTNRYANIFLLHNPNKTVPFALNIALQKCKGDLIIRLDAHTEYAPDYFTRIIETFADTGADIVGGPMRTVGKTNFQKAVAYATCTKFGVGDSAFHNETHEGYVDSVYLGAWKREIFKDVGFFDEYLKRNQDDDFHYRAKARGKKIYLNPEIKSFYYPRNSFKALFSQYFQYGLYKPIVLRKTKSEIKPRHLVPSAFLLYLLALPVLIFYSNYFVIPLLLYCALALMYSLRSNGSLQVKAAIFFVYPNLHISYGSGFLLGLLKV